MAGGAFTGDGMDLIFLFSTILVLSIIGYGMARARVSAKVQSISELHSLPTHYGFFALILTLVPASLVLVVWSLVQSPMIKAQISGTIPETAIAEGSSIDLYMADVKRVAEGIEIAIDQGLWSDENNGTSVDAKTTDVRAVLGQAGVALGNDVTATLLSAAQEYRLKSNRAYAARTGIVLGLSVLGLIFALIKVSPQFRARNATEAAVKLLLILASVLAILTTVGIVFSMLFETVRFFSLHSAVDFFFGLNWAPNFRGDSELAVLPLLFGTLYISLVALSVAVPIGLFAAIYLSEYASKPVRSTAKPLLEILAGIPTIVYGLFALVTFGPMLKAIFGDGGALGVNWMGDARSVMTAGVAMGLMLIPFVSSLSDDIINAVPQSLRDGSYGLGATKSETIRQVILPAALPGVVGAVLLAASRAIGETMIVVLGAGAIARFTANPLEALTTITTRIVSQLTGDGDFNSPETLVAFALGLTLFVITLGLNIIALHIVRKYREQYD